MAKAKTTRLWFFLVARGNRKSCSNCHKKLGKSESIWGWYEYINAKRRHIQDCCRMCWHEVRSQIHDFCKVNDRVPEFAESHPIWMVLDCPAYPYDNPQFAQLMDNAEVHFERYRPSAPFGSWGHDVGDMLIIADWLEEHGYDFQAEHMRKQFKMEESNV